MQVLLNAGNMNGLAVYIAGMVFPFNRNIIAALGLGNKTGIDGKSIRSGEN